MENTYKSGRINPVTGEIEVRDSVLNKFNINIEERDEIADIISDVTRHRGKSNIYLASIIESLFVISAMAFVFVSGMYVGKVLF